MDDAGLVGLAEGLEHLEHDRHELLREEPAVALDAVRERLAVEVLHHHVARVVGEDAEVEDLADVLRSDERRRLRLALEALDHVGLRRDAEVEHLDRHLAADADVLALVDGAHPSSPEQAHDAVLAVDDLAWTDVAPLRHGDPWVQRLAPTPSGPRTRSRSRTPAMTGRRGLDGKAARSRMHQPRA